MSCRRRRCRENDKQKAKAAVAATVEGIQIAPAILTTEGEGCRLWKHVVFGTNTCLSMLDGYADLGMPGDPVPELQLMVTKLKRIITKLEA